MYLRSSQQYPVLYYLTTTFHTILTHLQLANLHTTLQGLGAASYCSHVYSVASYSSIALSRPLKHVLSYLLTHALDSIVPYTICMGLLHTVSYHSLSLIPTATSLQMHCLRLVPRTQHASILNTCAPTPYSLTIANSLTLSTANSSISSPLQSACEGLKHYSGVHWSAVKYTVLISSPLIIIPQVQATDRNHLNASAPIVVLKVNL